MGVVETTRMAGAHRGGHFHGHTSGGPSLCRRLPYSFGWFAHIDPPLCRPAEVNMATGETAVSPAWDFCWLALWILQRIESNHRYYQKVGSILICLSVTRECSLEHKFLSIAWPV